MPRSEFTSQRPSAPTHSNQTSVPRGSLMSTRGKKLPSKRKTTPQLQNNRKRVAIGNGSGRLFYRQKEDRRVAKGHQATRQNGTITNKARTEILTQVPQFIEAGSAFTLAGGWRRAFFCTTFARPRRRPRRRRAWAWRGGSGCGGAVPGPGA